MDNRSKLLLVFVLLLLLFSIGSTYYQTIVRGDFQIIEAEEEELLEEPLPEEASETEAEVPEAAIEEA